MWTNAVLVYALFFVQSTGPVPATGFGASAVVVGDVNGDGFSDVAVGTDDSVWLLSGKNGAEIYRVEAPKPLSEFGHSLARTADLNGDGIPDLLVGAANEAERGAVYILSGRTGEVLSSVRSPQLGDCLGYAVLWIGSLNESEASKNLWAVSAPQRGRYCDNRPSGAGYVQVFSGLQKTPTFRFEGQQHGSGFGFSLAFDSSKGLGPFLAVGVPFYSSSEAERIGSVVLYQLSGAREERRLMGTAPGLQFGYALATNARVQRRESMQIAVGSSYGEYSAYRQGQVHLVDAVELSASWGVTSVAQERAFGSAITFLDGGAEYEAGIVFSAAPMNQLVCDVYPPMGTIALLSAVSGARIGSIDATGDLCQHNLPGNRGDHGPVPFGLFLGDAGDWDGDGRSDLLIGSPDHFGGGEVWIYSPHEQKLLVRFREWELLGYGPFAR